MHEQTAAARYSLNEEIAHSVTHGIGLLLSIIGLATMIVYSSMYGDAWHIVSTGIYGASLVVLYAASTLYHAITVPNIKKVFQKLSLCFVRWD